MKRMPSWDWSLADLAHVPKNGRKVFSCFSCGGGSTMGYKLAGYEMLGNVEIDPQMMGIYKRNHNPPIPFQMPIQEFKELPNDKLPPELFDLDILDGSPPCSVFSTSGKREKKWGKEHHFREGQAKQKLDELFFDFLDVADKLRPKVIVAENVRGMIIGLAKGYVALVKKRFIQMGYKPQLFLLNSATMGVPQRRERIFFIAHRMDIKLPKLTLCFKEQPVLYRHIRSGRGRILSPDTQTYQRWLKRRPRDTSVGDITKRSEGKVSNFNTILVHNDRVSNTLASGSCFIRYDEPYFISDTDVIRMQTFPRDYDFMGADVQYVCGMSVPPLMMKGIASEIYKQWLSKIPV
ncbi:DNA cytosine methyltransferase [Brevibacillus laterosporus]|uniref:DNA (cytosine-5-)-methyltransferase n=1 Tax=Brevibacillus laterosporus TaxID=1465 RepID=A0AAP3GDU4_BRELA|nr:DNA cytosine methyltransferase [Brevibacillus laterosporus]MCR8981629.1 DNA cytosine methyltransferase [Brevibacillus laterosporus]MCZ0808784.1 DNA cytosine methyltransferase [Brevibacillus laterosporus]MCZ0827243.1 DNA cytosine methyltransferase [Brevibacillus laterosporus]MCZ0850999.1 DNA cytosine methyltransferase [Brevibacillus laterosporus]